MPSYLNVSCFINRHLKRILITSSFCAAYLGLCKYAIKHPSEILRLGVGGSIANMLCETVFHIIDTVNIRSKVTGSIPI